MSNGNEAMTQVLADLSRPRRLAVLREMRGLTQEGLADEAEVSRQSISRWESESGIYEPSPSSYRKLANALNVEVSLLIN